MALPQEVLDLPTPAPQRLTVVEPVVARASESHPLAILGAEPAFREPLHVGRPNIGNREKLQERIDAMLDARWFSNGGPLVREFEERIARHIGVKHCIATCNGTTALMLAIRGLDLSGEVIVPSFTFVATAHGLLWQQTKPVFCDIDPETHNLDPAAVERLITPWTTGIIGVHLWGRPCAIDPLQELARKHRIKLLFDASHAFSCTHRGEFIGRFGDAEVFSFHATKFLNAFEGGAIVTQNDELAEKLRLMRNFGFTGTDTVEHIGMNAKMTEVCAAMGLTGLESINRFIAVNRRNHAIYAELLAGLPGLQVAAYDPAERSNRQYVIVEVDAENSPLTRDELIRVLQAERVLARRYFHPGCHRMEPYRTLFPASGLALPETERLSERILALPTGTAVTQGDVETVAAIICTALANATAVRAAIARA